MKVYVFKANNYYIGENLSDALKKLATVVEIDEIPEGKTLKFTRDEEGNPIAKFVDEMDEFDI